MKLANSLISKCANEMKGGVSHYVLKGSEASLRGSLAALEGRFINVLMILI